jgi:putative FmdB family regulatory protein
MPIYDYKCSNCEHQFELIQKFSDQPAKVCPECSKKSIQKLVSAPSFRLKGGGWYETDFKTGDKKNIVDVNDDKPMKPKETKKPTDTSPSPSKEK